MAADYRFARSPRWLATHVLVLGVVVGMVALGFWQLRRLDERRDRNDLVEARAALEPEPVGALVDPGDDADRIRFRAVTAAGTYGDEATTSVRTTRNGAPGGWVVSVLELGSASDGSRRGSAAGSGGDGAERVAVLRGFVGTSPDGSMAEPPPPSGAVVVEGVAVPIDRLERVARTAVERLAGTAPALLPVVVQQARSDPADADVLLPVLPPELGDGPHLAYAVQWFLFASVVAAGYPFLLRRRAGDDG